jgi:hypothetical protein|uniref:Uncharacterized protein n=1 Tax=viral metagenome TaxID=1070528 RepID=A0A6H1ZB33_9ZZZZ
MLQKHIEDHVSLGCSERSKTLGFQKMPEGYALMLDHDEAFFYWLRADGVHSDINWDPWSIYRSARMDADKISN